MDEVATDETRSTSARHEARQLRSKAEQTLTE